MKRNVAITRTKSMRNPLTKTSITLSETIKLIQEADVSADVRYADLVVLVREVQARRILSSTAALRILMSKINSLEHLLSRAIVYNILLQILIAASIQEKFKEDESMLTSESILQTLWEIRVKQVVEDKQNFWCEENIWLVREIEEDDDLMSNIMSVNGRFAVLDDDGVREKIDALEWVGRMVKSYLENHIIDPILEKLHPAWDPTNISKEKVNLKFLKAKVMLAESLIHSSCKAGARLLWMILMRRRHEHITTATQPIFKLVKEVFLENQHMVGIFLMNGDQYVRKGKKVIMGQDIFMGKVHDDHLLCWAARRDYSDLVYCIMQYERVSKTHPNYDVAQDESIILSWKYVVWTATHFKNSQALQYLLTWNDLDVHDYGHDLGLEKWLPPLHMVAFTGDQKVMKLLFDNTKSLQTNIRDYQGSLPLDIAMQGKDPALTIRMLIYRSQDVEKRFQELYNMYINHANTVLIGASITASVAFIGWLQPPLGYVDDYIAIDGHKSIQVFVIFNCLAFFLAIATMLIGTEATLYVHDKDDKYVMMKDMRSSLKWMIGFFMGSIVCFMGAYISAGIAVLPPFTWSIIASIIIGAITCFIPLIRILWYCTKSGILHHCNVKDHLHRLGSSTRDDNLVSQHLTSSIQKNNGSLQLHQHQLHDLYAPRQSLVVLEYLKELSANHDKLWISLKIAKDNCRTS